MRDEALAGLAKWVIAQVEHAEDGIIHFEVILGHVRYLWATVARDMPERPRSRDVRLVLETLREIDHAKEVEDEDDYWTLCERARIRRRRAE